MLRNEKCDYMNDDTLLILDHIDIIWKKHSTQFRWWILDIANRFGTTILLIIRNDISEELKSDLVTIKNFELGPLNDYESADLLIASSKRMITTDEL
mmetsp:Transcript_36566/g.42090  ORF Transcript_36566/g.42090 Transcript_36566/m.42090 type:complete len:97 (-) Transcript_36566:199-489(-)